MVAKFAPAFSAVKNPGPNCGIAKEQPASTLHNARIHDTHGPPNCPARSNPICTSNVLVMVRRRCRFEGQLFSRSTRTAEVLLAQLFQCGYRSSRPINQLGESLRCYLRISVASSGIDSIRVRPVWEAVCGAVNQKILTVGTFTHVGHEAIRMCREPILVSRVIVDPVFGGHLDSPLNRAQRRSAFIRAQHKHGADPSRLPGPAGRHDDTCPSGVTETLGSVSSEATSQNCALHSLFTGWAWLQPRCFAAA